MSIVTDRWPNCFDGPFILCVSLVSSIRVWLGETITRALLEEFKGYTTFPHATFLSKTFLHAARTAIKYVGDICGPTC